MLGVVTLVRNRNDLLARLLRGLAQDDDEVEVVVVRAGGEEDPAEVLADECGVATTLMTLERRDLAIPYAQARNHGAATLRTDHVCFLDADCIPGPGFVRVLGAVLDERDALATADVRYLPPGPAPDDAAGLRARSRPHPARPRPPAVGAVDIDHTIVWGLCMAMRRGTFETLGRFDTRYHGYAGEDTDLAVTARAAGVPAVLVGGTEVFHQHHDVYEPPIHQFEATLANATAFHDKWGWWPMAGWLEAMGDAGLVDWSPDAPSITIRRHPSAEDIGAARRGSALPFRSGA